MVELLVATEQKPDWYVSHWWGVLPGKYYWTSYVQTIVRTYRNAPESFCVPLVHAGHGRSP